MPLEFEDARQAQAWADEWVRRLRPSELVSSIEEYELQHQDQFNRDYGRFMAQFEVEYTALVKLLDQVNSLDKSGWPTARSVQFVLLAHNLKPFYSAKDRLSKGFYEDAVTLARTLYETFLRAVFISCHPSEPYAALVTRPPAGNPAFNVTNFLRDELRLDWSSNYAIMSLFAHSNMQQTREALMRVSQGLDEPERFGLQFRYNRQLADLAAVFLQFLVLVYLRFVIERFIGSATPVDHDQYVTAQESKDLLTYSFLTHPRHYWQRLALDVDFLFEVIDLADGGGDWRELVRARRQ